MKAIFALFLPIFLFSFTLSLNNGIEKGRPYSILEISDTKNFECVEQILAYDTKRYACMLDDDGILQMQDVKLDLMDIYYKKEGDKLFIVVLPKANSRLINVQNELFNDQNVTRNLDKTSKRFNIVVDPNLSEFDKKEPNGINFSPVFSSLLTPSIGALDFSKAPIEGFDSNDIDIYINIKRAYEKGLFNKVLDDTKIATQRHPQSIFAGEFLLYRLRAMDKIFGQNASLEELTPDDVIKEGKAWIRKFPSDENYAEVLYMIGRAYIKESLLSDAKYMIDILLNEHKNSKFTWLLMLDYADEIYKNGRSKDAIKFYEDVLYSTGDIDIASRAALALAGLNIQKESLNEAKKYILKITNANEKFLLNDRQKASEMAAKFLSSNMPDISARIYEILVQNSKKADEIYEVSLKNLGIALAKSGEINRAYEYLNRYESEFKYGDYLAEVATAKDGLFFELGENNSTKLHAYYKKLIEKYEKSDIGVKAVIADMKLNNDERKFSDTLGYTAIIKDLNQTEGFVLLNYAALELAKEAVRKNECQSVINLSESYDLNRLEIPQFKLFECQIRTARYKDANALALTHIKDENLEDRVEWLVNLSQSSYLLKDYENSVKAANEAISLAQNVEHSDPSPALFYRLYSLLKLDRFSEAMQTLNAAITLKGQEFKLIEAYDTLSRYAYSKNDFANAGIYAKKALQMQTDAKFNAYTPSLNFIYATSSLKLNELDDALDETRYILSLRLKPDERSRALALISDIFIAKKEPKNALPYLNECVKSNLNNAYTALCRSNLELVNLK